MISINTYVRTYNTNFYILTRFFQIFEVIFCRAVTKDAIAHQFSIIFLLSMAYLMRRPRSSQRLSSSRESTRPLVLVSQWELVSSVFRTASRSVVIVNWFECRHCLITIDRPIRLRAANPLRFYSCSAPLTYVETRKTITTL